MHFHSKTFALSFMWRLSFVAALFCSGVHASDWPQWMGEHRDGNWPEGDLLRDFQTHQPQVKWRIPIRMGYSGPAVVGDSLYVTEFEPAEPEPDLSNKDDSADVARRRLVQSGVSGREHVMAIDIATGQERWRHSADRTYSINYPEGPRATPTVDGDRVYVLGAMGHLQCLDRRVGKVLWERDLPTDFSTKPPVWGYASHPLIIGDKVYCTVGGAGSAVVCLDKMTGVEAWKAITAKEIGYAPLTLIERGDRRILLFWYDAAVAGLDPETGKLEWRIDFPLVPSGQVSVTIAQPVVHDDLVLVSEYYAGSMLIRLSEDLRSAESVWHSDPSDDKHEDDLNVLMTPPFVDGEWLFGVTGDGEMRCLELHSGRLLWRSTEATDKQPRESFGTVFWARNDDRYFVWNDKGVLQVATITPQGYEELGSIQLLQPTGYTRGREYVWSPPAFAAGCMFARNDQELICVDLTIPKS